MINVSAQTQCPDTLSFTLCVQKTSSLEVLLSVSSTAHKQQKAANAASDLRKPVLKPKANGLIVQTILQAQYRLFNLHLYTIFTQIHYVRFRLSTIKMESLGKFLRSQSSELLRKPKTS